MNDEALGGEVTFTPCELIDWFGPDSRWMVGRYPERPPNACGAMFCPVVKLRNERLWKPPSEELPF